MSGCKRTARRPRKRRASLSLSPRLNRRFPLHSLEFPPTLFDSNDSSPSRRFPGVCQTPATPACMPCPCKRNSASRLVFCRIWRFGPVCLSASVRAAFRACMPFLLSALPNPDTPMSDSPAESNPKLLVKVRVEVLLPDPTGGYRLGPQASRRTVPDCRMSDCRKLLHNRSGRSRVPADPPAIPCRTAYRRSGRTTGGLA